ncbi:hypothetical protein AGR13a_Cc260019 [Agrobacterium genomosp. 13 str. CFBP 6927]|uniref:Uncharacterized protein n=1 Tax=Agrobacterium genomosp. 13 str. CFBP 6927 TaxID=1183428 RepID=A0ABM9VEP5_9HYPH|nr:hypothetical protein AGR13a_Cc260019 [Agrobacterium genomosp. 13 str. CFBP 6927]
MNIRFLSEGQQAIELLSLTLAHSPCRKSIPVFDRENVQTQNVRVSFMRPNGRMAL